MSRHAFNPPGSAPPSPMYSFGAAADGWVVTSGIVAVDERGETQHPGDAAGQTRHVLDQVGRILRAAGCGFEDVLFVHVYLKTMADYADMNRVYAEYFGDRPPARFCVAAGLVKEDWLVEITATATAKAKAQKAVAAS